MTSVRCFRPASMLLALVVASAIRSIAAESAVPTTAPDLPDGLYAEIGTPRGTVVCELHATKTPLTVASFVGLAEGKLGPAPRKPFFDGLTFHRVVPDFVVQGGDPLGTGEGGPGFSFPDEFAPGLSHDAAGVLSMANDGPDTNGSQFFITLREVKRLDYLHSVFGHVVRGADVLPRIQQGDAMTVKIRRISAAAQAFRADDAAFNALKEKTKTFAAVTGAKPEPGPDAHFDDPDKLLPADPPRANAFNYKLVNFERSTGIRIAARVFAKSPTAAEDAQPGAYMSALGRRLGTMGRGAIVAYFADEDDWRVWVGNDSTGAFLGRAATKEDLAEGAAFHQAKEAFLKSARASGEAVFAAQKAKATAEKPLPKGQHIKVQMDAVLDGLMQRLAR